METYTELKNELLQLGQRLSDLFAKIRSIPGLHDHAFEGWEKNCQRIRDHLSEETLRVAVVGAIKSGKSTFVNSLFKGDHLKRGAGVVTSIVTKIRKGDALSANLCFKSWDEVNADMEPALVLFPSLDWREEEGRFDIRRDAERVALQQALDALGSDLLITNDTRNLNSVLLSSYLKGYDRVREMVSSETMGCQYDGDAFPKHRDFAGDDALAVYLRDIRLDIPSESIGSDIEIADCQGSDSPNPLHLAMIQDYLLSTHLIIYVISGRTGLRQADIRFLSVIRKMGIIGNILFVINFDFNEHESTDDLTALVEKIRAEISLIKPEPRIYTLSALFNLFRSQKEHLSRKDALRLGQWEAEHALSSLSDQETDRFQSYFRQKLASDRYSLLLKNHLERLGVIASGMGHRIRLHTDMLTRDDSETSEFINKIKYNQDKVNQISAMIKNTMDGVVRRMQQSLRGEIDSFFGSRTDGILGDTISFIRNYNVPYHTYEENLNTSGFANTLYLVFQEFRQATDTFMAETINPEIIRFARDTEGKLRERIGTAKGPYDVMISDALAEYDKVMETFGISPPEGMHYHAELPDVEQVKRSAGLTLPPAVASMHYSTQIKTEAVMRLGFYRVTRMFRRLFSKPVENDKEGEVLALKNGVARMKRETEKSLIFHFKDYRENIKFQYVFKLADALGEALYEILLDQFQGYATNLSQMAKQIGEKRTDTRETSEILSELAAVSSEISEGIRALGARLDS